MYRERNVITFERHPLMMLLEFLVFQSNKTYPVFKEILRIVVLFWETFKTNKMSILLIVHIIITDTHTKQ